MVISRPIKGEHRTIKDRINLILFALFLVTPFVRIGGHPLVLLDIPARKFYIFGLTIWPQELYFLLTIVLFLGVCLFFFTALLGRIWCGYACPQTIFTDAYDYVGRLVAGDKYGKSKMGKRVWTRIYLAWIALSIFFSFIFLGYFIPFGKIITDVATGNIFIVEGSYIPSFWIFFWAGSTGAAFFNMAYFRENMCKLVCPYGRFQTALLDKHSPIVDYEIRRGEPRRANKKQKIGEHKGDCVGCDLCVLSCPTGIDIRDGLQIGCIACGLCVDACSQVMGKFEKETLIDYRTIKQAEDHAAPRQYFRARTLIYGTLMVVLSSVFIYLLSVRVPVYAVATRDRAIREVMIPNVGVQNGYELHVGNMSYTPLRFQVKLVGASGKKLKLLLAQDSYSVAPEGLEKFRVIVRYPASAGEAPNKAIPIAFEVSDLENPGNKKVTRSVFTFPGYSGSIRFQEQTKNLLDENSAIRNKPENE